MTGATICSGILAPEAAMPWVDWKFCAEIEPFPCSVIKHHHPELDNLGDVTADDFFDRAKARGPIDLLVAGTPCQAFSVAGLRKSLTDSRGNITMRLVELVHAIRPRILLWENVPGVLSTKDNAFGCFLAGLVGATGPIEIEGRRWPRSGVVSGPQGSAAWIIRDAQYFGLAQRRKRVFLVFCPTGVADPREILLERPRLLWNPPTRGETRQDVTARAGGGADGRDWPADIAPPLNTSWADRSPGSQAQEFDSERGARFVPANTGEIK